MVGKKLIAGLAVFVLAIGAVVAAPVTANAAILDDSSGGLGELFVLDRLFGGDTDANLGDIFILDQLFNDGITGGDGGIVGGGSSDLGELFILSRLFGNDNNADLGDIFILDQLFDGNGLFGGDIL